MGAICSAMLRPGLEGQPKALLRAEKRRRMNGNRRLLGFKDQATLLVAEQRSLLPSNALCCRATLFVADPLAEPVEQGMLNGGRSAAFRQVYESC